MNPSRPVTLFSPRGTRLLYACVISLLAAVPRWCPADDKDLQDKIVFKLRQKGLKGGPKISPDGKIGVKVRGLTVQLYEVGTCKLIGAPLKHTKRRDDTKITTWAFSANGKLLASGAGDPRGKRQHDSAGEVKVWEVATGKELAAVSDRGADIGYVHTVAFASDGITVLVDCEEISGK
ncbi:MAG TPA: hypothetical protein VG013_24620 [Gemmataceae bacterium]|jgi:hypothetical protein|nr:hypothetical protein [Gemmataceae bacterium]